MRIKKKSSFLPFRISDFLAFFCFPYSFWCFSAEFHHLIVLVFSTIITIFLSFPSVFYTSLHSILSVSVNILLLSPKNFHCLTLSLSKLTTAVTNNCKRVGLHKPQEYVHVIFFILITWQMSGLRKDLFTSLHRGEG